MKIDNPMGMRLIIRIVAFFHISLIDRPVEHGYDFVYALIQALQDRDIRVIAAFVLGQIGTPEALKAVEEYQSRQ